MAPVKRQAREPSVKSLLKKIPKLDLPKLPEMCSVATQTETIKRNTLETVQQLKKFARPKTKLVPQQKWPDEKLETFIIDLDKLNTRNKACQTQKVGVRRLVPENQMGSLKAIMYKRRKLALDRDHSRLKLLMDQINSDPPPRWQEASKMWLDVDVLEKRIEEFQREESELLDGEYNFDF